jgi:hypothetical protein
VNKAVECVVKQKWVGLLSHEASSILQAKVADIVPKQILHRARAGDKKAGMGKASHNDLGCLEKNSLAFSDWQIKSADHSKDEIVGMKGKLLARLQGVSSSHRAKEGGIDSCMNDLKFF